MIIGLIKRHYKIYNNINFIPISSSLDNSLSLFIGNNGVGKSSILESINTFFNNGYWNRSKNEKQDQTFICPVFLIKKSEFISKLNLNNDDKDVLEIISSYLFEIAYTATNREIKDFFNLRDNIITFRETHYLVICGITYKDRNKIYFGSSFHTDLVSKIIDSKPDYKYDNILNCIKKYYSYIYIPVESKIDDVLKLETLEMQKLMNEDILETIEDVLKENRFKPHDKKSSINLVTYINEALNNFMDDINSQIKRIDEDYSFKVEDGYKKNLTASDLREQILKAYFSIRTLKKKWKRNFSIKFRRTKNCPYRYSNSFLK